MISSPRTRFAKIGPGRNDELPTPLVEDPRARDVRGHEVGGELDAGGFESQNPCQRAHDKGFGQPRNVLQQDVASGQHPYQHKEDRLPLAHDCSFDLGDDVPGDRLDVSWGVSGVSAVSEGVVTGGSRATRVGRGLAHLVKGDTGLETILRRLGIRVHERVGSVPSSSMERLLSDRATPVGPGASREHDQPRANLRVEVACGRGPEPKGALERDKGCGAGLVRLLDGATPPRPRLAGFDRGGEGDRPGTEPEQPEGTGSGALDRTRIRCADSEGNAESDREERRRREQGRP